MSAPTSKYFSTKELSCGDGCGLLPRQEFIDLINQIREDYGKPLYVNSAARCSVHNRAIGGARFSAHTLGIAIDFRRDEEFLAWITPKLDFYGLWMEEPTKTPGWHHLDTKYRPVGRIFQP